MTHDVEVTVTLKVRLHVAHGLAGAREKAAVKAAKKDVADWVARRVVNTQAFKPGDVGWWITGYEG